ncbi:MAG TPA: glycosyltransferase family 39 protein, partial [Longimicrobiales bacterium]|nr:glycosyltransferase family 39 protein [Longimicrobiales bacterium]
VLAALVIGVASVEEPATVLPLTLEIVLLALLTWTFLVRERRRDLRRWLGGLVLAALALRVGVLVAVHFVVGAPFFAPDAASYAYQGGVIADFWAGAGPPPDFELGSQVVYPYLNAVFAYLLGDPTFGAVVLNLFAGIWTALLVFAVGRELADDRVAKVAATLTAVFPSLVLWSVLNVRDALTMFGVVLLVYFGLRVYRRQRPLDLVAIGFGVLFLAGLRDYMGFLVLAGLVLGAAAAVRPGRVGTTLAGGTILVLVLVFGMEQLGLFQRVVVENPLEAMGELRRGLTRDFGGGEAGSAFAPGVEVDSVGDVLRFLPVGLAFFLFAPFPWAVSGVLQTITLPEVLIWYALTPFTVLGFVRATDRGRRTILVAAAVLLLVVASYALVEGNFGTAYRHRAQVMPLFFLFTAVGIVEMWERWRARRRAAAERRRQARSTLSSSSSRRP